MYEGLTLRTDDLKPTHTITLEVTGRLGLHARPCMDVVDTLSSYDGDIRVVPLTRSKEHYVNGKSILQLPVLAAGQGSKLNFEFYGPRLEEHEKTDIEERLTKILADAT